MSRRARPGPEAVRLLVFRLAGFEHAVDVARVEEIIRPARLWPVAGAPAYIAGVVKRRGRLTPIVDLRRRLGLPRAAPTPNSCAIIARLPLGLAGLVVDEVLELIWVAPAEFQPPSALLAGPGHAYVQGLAQFGGRLIIRLDVERLFSAAEVQALAEAGREAQA